MLRLVLPVSGLVAAVVCACGLVSSDVDDFKLRMPPQPFRLDSSDWSLPADTDYPQVACTAGGDECSAAELACGDDECQIDCDAGSCRARVRIGLRGQFDLAEDGPGYQALDGKTGVAITIDEIYFEIAENTLNVATPEL